MCCLMIVWPYHNICYLPDEVEFIIFSNVILDAFVMTVVHFARAFGNYQTYCSYVVIYN